MKEAIISYELILKSQSKDKHADDTSMGSISDEQKMYLFKMITVITNKFGTNDLEWFCAAESILNCLFNIKSRNSHEYAKLVIE